MSSKRGYVPAEPDAHSIIDMARDRDMVLECTGASGVTYSFVHAFDSMWVAREEPPDCQPVTYVVDRDYEETIRKTVVRCDPDIRLVGESLSTFGGDSDDD